QRDTGIFPVLLENLQRAVRGTDVTDIEMKVRIGLIQDAVHLLRNIALPVVGGEQDSDFLIGLHEAFPPFRVHSRAPSHLRNQADTGSDCSASPPAEAACNRRSRRTASHACRGESKASDAQREASSAD